MKFEHVILGMLSWRPFSGYELAKYLEVEGSFMGPKVHLSQIYRLLARMTYSGWVHYEVSVNDGRPDSKIYRLTEEGTRELRDWAASPYETPVRFPDPEFSARFLFGGPVDRDALLRLVRTELEERRAQVATFRDRDRSIGPVDPIEGVDPGLVQRLGDLSHQLGAARKDLWIEWLEGVLGELEAAETARGGVARR